MGTWKEGIVSVLGFRVWCYIDVSYVRISDLLYPLTYFCLFDLLYERHRELSGL